MAKTTKSSTLFPMAAAKLLQVMTHPEYRVQTAQLSEAVKEARYALVSQTDDKLVFEVRSTEYERGMTGIDKKKTVETVTHVEWDLKALRSTWTYRNPAVERLALSGSSRIEPVGDECRLHSEASVEVRIPLVGGKVEGMIVEGIEKGREKDAALIREWAKKLG